MSALAVAIARLDHETAWTLLKGYAVQQEPFYRKSVVKGLELVPGQDSAGEIYRLTADESSMVRIAALDALAKRPYAETREFIILLLDGDSCKDMNLGLYLLKGHIDGIQAKAAREDRELEKALQWVSRETDCVKESADALRKLKKIDK